ncbi:bifunctional choline kinase/ethanolamine kinase EKI1 KNAG_0A05150 [Huiozyma naganishii CBS 8797]|uniref:Choline kinase N-terminal domain-containing protein n=1 Tax=Huiozyma naganishii (strain ATCC MYA-139 / BCRC 22969 / CBS 8797 / KCTC 17520 / NBRC 10181 / NCYC 3082 / Yp74L-3) TaxID=1071383 RepID=J7RTT7_HUIN7|nr:hypothetical protein KNAG_0A05150 [Kazachstania naganishii CBS 8797]CCK68182.1 hypothetical protein KNAG_0A05150 [Kazachstania naganishii CBS 8797]
MKRLHVTIPLDAPDNLVSLLTDDCQNYEIVKLKGALTNVIYKLSIRDSSGTSTSYLVRIFGAKLESLVDRVEEFNNITRVPPVVGYVNVLYVFDNGRVEYFLEGFKSVSAKQMVQQNVYRVLAQKFKALHCLVSITDKEIAHHRDGMCWYKLGQWIEIIENINGGEWIDSRDHQNVTEILLCRDWATFKKTVLNYKNWLLEEDAESFQQMKFCHNDAQQGNILLDSKTKDDDIPNLNLIDYEYSGVNAIQFDLANFLTECMHDYEIDESYKCHGEQYPSKEKVLDFLYHYSTHLHHGDSKGEASIVKLYNSVLKWRAASQLFWSVWAILQSGQLEAASAKIEAHVPDKGSNRVTSSDDPNEEVFDYMGFCNEKLSYFWGDMIKFNLASKEDCIVSKVRYLDTEFI